ncbi:MAG: hypothetical protein H7641_10010 [Candidatus Heimdallarchaeota archaeon]|nr:hypothetical protein [Candidatus Heimdallarchaeota archaeon]MCK4877896.1 hypothetical protein [Candidatus Heimdallarchaeota archaeon]
MNKRGLILIFLFVIASIGALAPAYAAESSTNIVNLSYGAPHNLDKGEVYVDLSLESYYDVELDTYDISFWFFVDCAISGWSGYFPGLLGYGWQMEYWYWDTPNDIIANPDLPLYNETRYAGQLVVMLDDYSLGLSNADWSAVNISTYQDITIELETGWHYITVIAGELVSDDEHTEFDYQFAKDQVRFYIGKKGDAPAAYFEEATYNTANLIATPTLAADMGQAFNYSNTAEIRVLTEPTAIADQTVALGTEKKPVTVDVEALYNSSTGDLTLFDSDGFEGFWYGPLSLFEPGTSGPTNISWIVNDGPQIFGDEATLYKGLNYVYCVVFGIAPDPYSVGWLASATANGGLGRVEPALRGLVGIPGVYIDTAIFMITVGLDEAGPNFGIFISVSILGLVTALFVMRRRK